MPPIFGWKLVDRNAPSSWRPCDRGGHAQYKHYKHLCGKSKAPKFSKYVSPIPRYSQRISSLWCKYVSPIPRYSQRISSLWCKYVSPIPRYSQRISSLWCKYVSPIPRYPQRISSLWCKYVSPIPRETQRIYYVVLRFSCCPDSFAHAKHNVFATFSSSPIPRYTQHVSSRGA